MKKTIFAFVILVLLGLAVMYMANQTSSQSFVNNSMIAGSTTESALASPGGYTSAKYNFSVKLPEGFSAREISPAELGPDSFSDSVVFENGKGDGIQIVITPFDDIKVLTADMVKKDIPDMKMEQVQTIDIGQSYKGIAFLSDSPEFGGKSRDVWFVFKGNLYQISTYARLDTLLQSIFSTWQFK